MGTRSLPFLCSLTWRYFRLSIFLAGISVPGILPQLSQAASLTWIGAQAAGDFEAVNVSGDGSTVSFANNSNNLVYWTETGGLQFMLSPIATNQQGKVRGLSEDGSVIVGSCFSSPCGASSPTKGFRWTLATGVEALPVSGPYPNSYAEGISADGTRTAGGAGFGAAPTAWNGTTQQTVDPDYDPNWSVNGISPDGSVIVGGDLTPSVAQQGARRWTYGGSSWTESIIGTVPTSGPGLALAASNLGETIIGVGADTNNLDIGWYWTAGSGIVLLQTGGWPKATALALSDDGSRLVGYGLDGGNTTALVWDGANSAPRSLEDILVNDYGIDLQGESLLMASGISLDGTTIVGYGGGNSLPGGSVFYVRLDSEPPAELVNIPLLPIWAGILLSLIVVAINQSGKNK